MPIEVEAPDGTIIEFPDGMADADIESVMAKQFPATSAGKRMVKADATWNGIKVEFDLPEDATDQEFVEAARAALSKAYKPDPLATATGTKPLPIPPASAFNVNRPEPAPSFTDTLVESAGDLAANISNGFFALPDMAIEGAGALGRFLATGGGAASGTVGNPSDADRFANLAFPQGQTMRDFNTRANPDAGSAPSAFAGELFGAALLPIGPKAVAPPVGGYGALSRAETAASRPRGALADVAPAKGVIPGADEIIQAGEREGVRVMTSDVKPPRTFLGKMARATGERIPVAGTGGPRAAQQEERIAAVKGLLDDFGASEAITAADDVAADLAKTRGAELTRLSTAKSRIINGLPGEVPAPRTVQAINEQIGILEKVDTDAARAVIAKLENWKQALEVAGKTVDTGLLDSSGAAITRKIPPQGKELKTIELIRREMGDAFAGQDMAHIRSTGEKALSKIYGPMREDMGTFIQTAGGPGARGRWKDVNDRLAAMAGQLNNRAFKSVLNDAESTPENVAKLLFSKKPSEVQRLVSSLSPAGRTKAQAAILFRAADGATENGVVSPQKFANAMEAMHKATGVVFSAADKVRIDGMVRLLKATQQSSVASAAPPTGVQNAPGVIGAGFVGLFGGAKGLGAAGLTGLLARAYESAPVRDWLLRVGRSKPGTRGEKVAMDGLTAALTKMLPVAANDVEGALAASPAPRVAAEEDDNIRREPPAQ